MHVVTNPCMHIEVGLDTLCFFPMLSSHAYYAFEVNLLFSNYAENFLVHRQNILFSMRAHALNEGPCTIVMFSQGEGFKSSLLFSLV